MTLLPTHSLCSGTSRTAWWATARLEQFRTALEPHSTILGGRAKVQVQWSVAELALQLDHAELTTDEVGGIHADISKAFEGLAH
eukprot:630727-Amphidinium_carterae.1